MDIILIPGLWLDAKSWSDVLPELRDAGHRTHPVTMRGVGEPATVSADVGMRDWVDQIVAAIDGLPGDRLALVGHSGGGNVAWAAAARRPDRVARVILVDTVPPPPGGAISEFPIENGVVPFPGWDFFDDDDVHDLDDVVRARTAPLALSVPARVPTDALDLEGDERFRVPVTLLMGAMDRDAFEAVIDEWGAYGREYRAIESTEVVRLGTGHWPQFSAPARLAAEIVRAIDR